MGSAAKEKAPAGGGGAAQRSVVHIEAPIVHERLGARAVLVVDAAVVAPPPAGDAAAAGGGGEADGRSGGIAAMVRRAWTALRGGGAPAGGSDDSEAWREHRQRRLEERAARRERRARLREERGEHGAPHAPDVAELHEFIQQMSEDVEDEARFGGGEVPPLQFNVTRAELRMPGGRVVDITDEIGGLFVEGVFDAAHTPGGRRPPPAADRGRVIDADWSDPRR